MIPTNKMTVTNPGRLNIPLATILLEHIKQTTNDHNRYLKKVFSDKGFDVEEFLLPEVIYTEGLLSESIPYSLAKVTADVMINAKYYRNEAATAQTTALQRRVEFTIVPENGIISVSRIYEYLF